LVQAQSRGFCNESNLGWSSIVGQPDEAVLKTT
jgi:hypothetical protein